MNIFSSIILGVVQGFTEFLPVSSSGHLVIAQSLIPNFTQPGVMFDTLLHAGTLLSVLIYFRDKILKLNAKYILLIAVGTIPAATAGFFFQNMIELLFTSIKVVGIALIFTGIMNYMTDKTTGFSEKLSYGSSFVIGMMQALAIIPGISRSGSTIFAGTKLGIKKAKAAEFSFLLSIPAILGANLLQLFDYLGEAGGGFQSVYFFGFAAAFLSGYAAINLVFKFLKEGKFKVFSYYAIVLGLVVLIAG